MSTETVQLTNEFNLTNADRKVKVKALHKQLESLMFRWLKRKVLTSLPTKNEGTLRVERCHSAMQAQFYKNIPTKVCTGFGGVLGSKLTLRTRVCRTSRPSLRA